MPSLCGFYDPFAVAKPVPVAVLMSAKRIKDHSTVAASQSTQTLKRPRDTSGKYETAPVASGRATAIIGQRHPRAVGIGVIVRGRYTALSVLASVACVAGGVALEREGMRGRR